MSSSTTSHAAVEQPSRIKRIFWYMAPIQSSVVVQATNTTLVAESYPSPRVSTCGHIFYALLWTFAVAAYSVFVTYQHFTLPDAEYFMHEPANQQPMPEVTVEMYCSRVGQCGTFTLTADYTDAPSWCQPKNPRFNRSWGAFEHMKGRTWTLPLCYTGETVYSTYNDNHMPGKLGLIVDFESINMSPNLRPDPSVNTPAPYVYPTARPQSEEEERAFAAQDHHAKSSTSTAVVRLTGPNGLNRTINLEAWQVKTVVMGQSVMYHQKEYVSSSVFPLAVQYEGRRPSLRATAVVSLAEYADVTRVEVKKGDVTFRGLMTLLGIMCGMAFMMNSCQIFIEPVIVFLFPGPAEIARRKAVEDAKKAGAADSKDAPLLGASEEGSELVPVASGPPKSAAPLPPDSERGGDIDGSHSPMNAAQSTHMLAHAGNANPPDNADRSRTTSSSSDGGEKPEQHPSK